MNSNLKKMLGKHYYYFNKYSPDLEKIFSDLKYGVGWYRNNTLQHVFTKDIYICPFCRSNFIAILHNEIVQISEFTLDHFPPESVGGRKKLLVCKPCNNNYGQNLDHYLLKYINLQSFLKDGDDKIDFNFSYPASKSQYKGSLKRQDGNFIMEMPLKKYPLVREWLSDNSKPERSFTTKFLAPDEVFVARAIIRVTFMFCYNLWGYEFLFSQLGIEMYNYIEDIGEYDSGCYGITFTNDPLPIGVSVISNSVIKACTAISFPIISKNRTYKMNIQVFIPYFNTDEDRDTVKRFISIIQRDKVNSFTYKFLG